MKQLFTILLFILVLTPIFYIWQLPTLKKFRDVLFKIGTIIGAISVVLSAILTALGIIFIIGSFLINYLSKFF